MKTKIIHFLFVFILLTSVSLSYGFKTDVKPGKNKVELNNLSPKNGHVSSYADHRLPNSGNLPSNGGVATVSTRMSTVMTYGLIKAYLTGTGSIDDYIEKLRVYEGLSTTNDAIAYINNGSAEGGMASYIDWYEFRESLFYFGSGSTIQDEINSGNPLVAIFTQPTSPWASYVVMITGYNNSGTIEYFDPTTGYYANAASSCFFTPTGITGLK